MLSQHHTIVTSGVTSCIGDLTASFMRHQAAASRSASHFHPERFRTEAQFQTQVKVSARATLWPLRLLCMCFQSVSVRVCAYRVCGCSSMTTASWSTLIRHNGDPWRYTRTPRSAGGSNCFWFRNSWGASNMLTLRRYGARGLPFRFGHY